MRLANGYTCFTGIAFVLGGILPVIGMAIHLLLVEKNLNFQPADFATISAHRAAWILSCQVMVFGLFVRLAGLALGRVVPRWLVVLGGLTSRGVEQKPG